MHAHDETGLQRDQIALALARGNRALSVLRGAGLAFAHASNPMGLGPGPSISFAQAYVPKTTGLALILVEARLGDGAIGQDNTVAAQVGGVDVGPAMPYAGTLIGGVTAVGGGPAFAIVPITKGVATTFGAHGSGTAGFVSANAGDMVAFFLELQIPTA